MQSRPRARARARSSPRWYWLYFLLAALDVITVLVNGQLIACGSPEAVRNSPEVRVAYLGEH